MPEQKGGETLKRLFSAHGVKEMTRAEQIEFLLKLAQAMRMILEWKHRVRLDGWLGPCFIRHADILAKHHEKPWAKVFTELMIEFVKKLDILTEEELTMDDPIVIIRAAEVLNQLALEERALANLGPEECTLFWQLREVLPESRGINDAIQFAALSLKAAGLNSEIHLEATNLWDEISAAITNCLTKLRGDALGANIVLESLWWFNHQVEADGTIGEQAEVALEKFLSHQKCPEID